MGEVVNLRRARKGKAQEADEARAAENRAKFGRTKAEKEQAALESKRADKQLDGHERET